MFNGQIRKLIKYSINYSLFLFLAVSNSFAQGTISDAPTSFTVNSSGLHTGTNSPSANWQVPISGSPLADHLFETGWFYRVSTDTKEFFFPAVTTQAFNSNTATFTWNNVDSKGFSAVLNIRIIKAGANASLLQMDMKVTNNNQSSVDITVFHMADFDLQPTAGNDSAASVDNKNNQMKVTQATSSDFIEYRALADNASYLVRPFGASDLGAEFGNATITNFDNTGLPFGPGDMTAAYAFPATIAPGRTATFSVIFSFNTAAPNGTGACLLANNSCSITSEALCLGQSGVYGQSGTDCSDTDGDLKPNVFDNCPADVNPSQEDSDTDGSGDVCDTCTDLDGDSFGDNGFPANTCPLDLCPSDAAKSAVGFCGCGNLETDGDGDGQPDCIDLCAADPVKNVPGKCGCGISDADTDSDGTVNCQDLCATDPAKQAPGVCGCGTSDIDANANQVADCKFNDELKLQLSAITGLIKGVKFVESTKKRAYKKQSAHRRLLKKAAEGINTFATQNLSGLIVKDVTINLSTLSNDLLSKVKKLVKSRNKIALGKNKKNSNKVLGAIIADLV